MLTRTQHIQLITAIEVEILEAVKGSDAEGWMRFEARSIAAYAVARFEKELQDEPVI